MVPIVIGAQPATARKDTTACRDIAEFEVALALMRSGRTVLRPISAGLRYDLVIDEGNANFTRCNARPTGSAVA